MAGALLWAEAGGVDTQDFGAARVGLEQVHEDFNGCTLACAVGAGQGEDAAAGHFEAYVCESVVVTVAPGEIVGFDHLVSFPARVRQPSASANCRSSSETLSCMA